MKYFKQSEFDSPDIPGSGENMQDRFLLFLNQARQHADTPFKINSGFRTVEHNKKIKGSKTSSHLKGVAVDISCKNSIDREKILYGLIQAGFKRIGIAKTFIHTDLDTHKPYSIWLY